MMMKLLLTLILLCFMTIGCKSTIGLLEQYYDTSVPWLQWELRGSIFKPGYEDILFTDLLLDDDAEEVDEAVDELRSINPSDALRIIYIWQRRYNIEKCTIEFLIEEPWSAYIDIPIVGGKWQGRVDHEKIEKLDTSQIEPILKDVGVGAETTLAKLLVDSCEDVNYFAIETIILLKIESDFMIEALIDSLHNPISSHTCAPSPPWQSEYLSRISPEKVTGPLAAALCDTDRDEKVRSNAAEALSLIDISGNPDVIRAILKCLTDDSQLVRQEAVKALGAQDNLEDYAIRELIETLYDSSSSYDVRKTAAETLSKYGSRATEAIPGIMALVEEAAYPFDTIPIFGGFGPDAEEALPFIMGYLNHDDRSVRKAAALTLPRISKGQQVIEALAKALENEDNYWTRRIMVINFTEFDPEPLVIQVLIKSLEDEEDNIRTLAADGLGNFGEVAFEALPFLRELAAQTPELRYDVIAAKEAIEKIETHTRNDSGTSADTDDGEK